MSEKRIILEMGTGNDLYGQDYTKAARPRGAGRAAPFFDHPVCQA